MAAICLSFADIQFQLHTEETLPVEEEFLPFLVSEADDSVQSDVDSCYTVSYIPDPGEKNYSMIAEGRRIKILYDPSLRSHFKSIRGCLIHLPIETLLLTEKRFFLHSSVIRSDYGGILFSGPSGIGKSTQAELWRQYRNSTLVNGDRAILEHSENDCWKAHGSPYAGSSGCYRREHVSVIAIVFLEQSPENQIRRLKQGEAVKLLLHQISLNGLDADAIEKLMCLLQRLTECIPVYLLQCTADERAVEALETRLLQEVCPHAGQ